MRDSWRLGPRPRAPWLAGLPLLLAALPVLGQGAEKGDLLDLDLEALLQVRVTGSHLRGADGAAASMIGVIDRETIERSGSTTIESLLQRLPISAGYAGNQGNTYWGGPDGPGSAHVNLRGLGINRTLVLLNGRRLANGGSGANAAVDLNIIPLAMVERIELLKHGASAIYGADAVAGVVNIITRKTLAGFEAGLRLGQSFRQDGAEHAADVGWGISMGRGTLLLGLSHSGNGAVLMSDRAVCGLGEVAGRLVCVDSGNTIGGRALLADGRRVNFNQQPGGDGNAFETYAVEKHNFNSNPYLNVLNPVRRTQLSGFGTLALGERLTGFAELLLSERNSDQRASPGTIGLNRPINIAAQHPTNPTGQDLLLQRRRLLEGGPRQFFQDVRSTDLVVGVEGALASGWEWSGALSWRRNTVADGSTQVANLDRVDQTLNTKLCSNAAGAAIPCADYLGYGDVSQRVLDYIMFTARYAGGNEQKGLNLTLNGHPFKLPAGPLALAAGVEVRHDRGWRDPDPLTVLGIANENKQDPVAGAYTARELYGEIDAPLLKGAAWAKSLGFSAALRHSDYGELGRSTNHKLRLDWQPLESLRGYVNFATAFRAPNIPELFSGIARQNLITADPCSGWSQLPADSVVRQNCAAAGVPTGYRQLVTSILTTNGGNRQLKPEQARTYSLGALWEPDPGLSLSLDVFRIAIDDAIGATSGSSKLAACYGSPGLSHPFCSPAQFRRNAQTGDIDFLSIQKVNTASERLAGVDVGLQSSFRLADWKARLHLQATNLRRYELLPYPGAQPIQLAGRVTSGRGSYPRWRSLGMLTLEQGAWSGGWTVQTLGSVSDLTAAPTAIGARVPRVVYQHLQLQYASGKSWRLAGGIDNLLDRKPPYVASWIDANTDTMSYESVGRRWYLAATLRW